MIEGKLHHGRRRQGQQQDRRPSAGKAKEGLGRVTGDKDTENKGKADQAKSSLKDAGEKVKDAFKK